MNMELIRERAKQARYTIAPDDSELQAAEKSLARPQNLGDWLEKAQDRWGDTVIARGPRGGEIYGYRHGKPIYQPKSKAVKDDGKPGESLEETPTKELQATLKDIRVRIDDPDVEGRDELARRQKAIHAELERRAGKTDLSEKSMVKGDVTPEKAKQILRDGEVHGQPLTDQQKKFFGAIAGGEEPQQKSLRPAGDLSSWLAREETGMDTDDWLKAQEMPEGDPREELGVGPEQGGDLKGKGKTTGKHSGSPGPGQDRQGQVTGAKTNKRQKLSEDDEEDEAQMRPHTKPIESAKSMNIPGAQRDAVAHENAVVASRLRKGRPDVHVDTVGLAPEPEPSAPLEQGRVGVHGMVRYSEETDKAVSRLYKSRDFYTGGSPAVRPFARPIGANGVCPECESRISKSLTACPVCGYGATQPQVISATEPAPQTNMAKSRPGGLRPRRIQDVKIED